jgi:hypothetical protein
MTHPTVSFISYPCVLLLFPAPLPSPSDFDYCLAYSAVCAVEIRAEMRGTTRIAAVEDRAQLSGCRVNIQ